MSFPLLLSVFKREERGLGVAVVGAGTVGKGVLELMRRQRAVLRRRCGVPLFVAAVVRRDVGSLQELEEVEGALLSSDWRAAVAHPDVDVVVELMGGTGAAGECVRAALAAEKPVVTANKALLAESCGGDGDVLAAAAAVRLPVAHEAAIAGCIPVVKTLREAFAGDSVRAVFGVINGTCNYILTAMETAGVTFDDALAQAQRLGFAEANPGLDIDGVDAAHKLLLVARMAFGCRVAMGDLPVVGVRGFDGRDIVFARRLGFRVKLLAVAKRAADGVVEARVRPALLPARHAMARVEGATNVVTVHSEFAGETMFVGAGAGAHPTAVAVLADVVDVARRFEGRRYRHVEVDGEAGEGAGPGVRGDFSAPFYLRLRVIDRPGVLADVTRVLADRGISIESMRQDGAAPGEEVDVVTLLHSACEAKVVESLAAIEALEAVRGEGVAIPIERLEG